MKIKLLNSIVLLAFIFVIGCGKKEEPQNLSQKTKVADPKSSVQEKVKEVPDQLKIVPNPSPSTESFLPANCKDWEDFEQKNISFRKKRATAQNELPVNKDGSRVWLGQIVYTDDALDKQIKTFAMSRKLVKGDAPCSFMKMDGTKLEFDDPGLSAAIGKLAAKKYVKVFGTIDDDAVIHNVYINVAGVNYIFQNGELVKESERVK